MLHELFGLLTPQAVAGRAHVSPDDMQQVLQGAAPQAPPTSQLPAVAGLDDILSNNPQQPRQPYALDASADPSILEQYLQPMGQAYGQGLKDLNAYSRDMRNEQNRSNRREFWDELTGNVLMPASAIGLPGAVDKAMDESKRILDDLSTRRKSKATNLDTQNNLVNNLAKIIRQVDPADIDNQIKQREQMLRERQFAETQKQNAFGNDLDLSKFREDTRWHGEMTRQFDIKSSQDASQHADDMEMKKQEIAARGAELQQRISDAQRAGKQADASRMLEELKLLSSQHQQAEQTERSLRQKALEMEQQERLHPVEVKAKPGVKQAPAPAPRAADYFYQAMGGTQGLGQPMRAQQGAPNVDALKQYRDQVRALIAAKKNGKK